MRNQSLFDIMKKEQKKYNYIMMKINYLKEKEKEKFNLKKK